MKRFNNLIWIVFVVCLSACMKDEPNINIDSEKKMTQIPLSFVSPTEIKTYGADEGDNLNIESVYLLVFSRKDGTYVGGELSGLDVIRDSVKNPIKYVNSADGSIPILSTQLSIAIGDQIVVLLNVTPTRIPLRVGKSKTQDINNAFALNGAENTSSRFGIHGFPMSGAMIFGRDKVCRIYRSLAQIQVELARDVYYAPSVAPLEPNLTAWYLCNYPDLESTAIFSENPHTSIVIKDSPVIKSDQTPIKIAINGHVSTKKFIPEFRSSITANRSIISKNTFSPFRACIILQALSERGDKVRYYRIELGKKDDNGDFSYIDIKRNHKYRIIINRVGGHGYLTMEDALKNPGSNITFEIIDNGEICDQVIKSNGQYALGVECVEILAYVPKDTEFSVKARIIVNDVNLSYPLPPSTITCSEGITLTGIKTLSVHEQEIKFKLSAEKSPNTTDLIYVTVGNLTQPIAIHVSPEISGKGEVLSGFKEYESIRWVQFGEGLTATFKDKRLTVNCEPNSGSATVLKGVAYFQDHTSLSNVAKLILYQGGN